jgi:hypothetical protein
MTACARITKERGSVSFQSDLLARSPDNVRFQMRDSLVLSDSGRVASGPDRNSNHSRLAGTAGHPNRHIVWRRNT